MTFLDLSNKFSYFVIACLLQVITAAGAPNPKVMNGYRAEDFGDFEKKWHLVTVRFRKDTGEMRWTYANDKAWRTLGENKTNYPDGAVFAKVGMMTDEDPAFPSSAVPSKARRVQFMVRDAEKHRATEGWGYALFDSSGNIFPGDEAQATAACAACHRLVPQRGYVFSQIAGMFSREEKSWRAHLTFLSTPVNKIPAALRKRLPPGVKSVRVISGDLARNIFPGTLDEIVPLLAREAREAGIPAALSDPSGEQYALVIPSKEKGSCAENQLQMTRIHSLSGPGAKVYEKTFCEN